MKIVVVGCGRAGAELAVRLVRRGHEVAVVDSSGAAFSNLPPEFSGRTVQGDALAEGVLAAAGIGEADAIAAVTASDAVNAVVAHAARVVFGVKRVVVRSYAPRRESIHGAFGHQAISSTVWGAQRLEEMLGAAGGESEASVGSGDVQVWRFEVPERGIDGFAPSGPGYCVVAVTRGGHTAVLEPGFAPRPGDVLHVAAARADLDRVKLALAGEGGA